MLIYVRATKLCSFTQYNILTLTVTVHTGHFGTLHGFVQSDALYILLLFSNSFENSLGILSHGLLSAILCLSAAAC